MTQKTKRTEKQDSGWDSADSKKIDGFFSVLSKAPSKDISALITKQEEEENNIHDKSIRNKE